jgi:dihydropteroate synthase
MRQGWPSASEPSFHIVTLDSHIHTICQAGKDQVDIIGKSVEEIGDELQLRGLLPGPRHALDVGKELARAELALAMGRSYIQDEPLLDGEHDAMETGDC